MEDKVSNIYDFTMVSDLMFFKTIKSFVVRSISEINISPFYVTFFVLIFACLYSIFAHEKNKLKKFIIKCTPALCFIFLNFFLSFTFELKEMFGIQAENNSSFIQAFQYLFLALSLILFLYFLVLSFSWKLKFKYFMHNSIILMLFVISINPKLIEIFNNAPEKNYDLIIEILILAKNTLIYSISFFAVLTLMRFFFKNIISFSLGSLIIFILFMIGISADSRFSQENIVNFDA